MTQRKRLEGKLKPGARSLGTLLTRPKAMTALFQYITVTLPGDSNRHSATYVFQKTRKPDKVSKLREAGIRTIPPPALPQARTSSGSVLQRAYAEIEKE